MVVAYGVGVAGNLSIAVAVGISPLSLFLMCAWAFMTTFIVAAVDESVRN